MTTVPFSAKSLFDLTGRAAVVTGGGGALGSYICAGLAQSGASVAVVDLRLENAARVAAEIEAAGGKSIGIGSDVSREAEVATLFAEVERAFGAVDILVNGVSAAVERKAPEEVTLEAWQHMLDSNLTSYFLCSQAAGRRMIAAGRGGSIVNISSIGGVTALGRGAMSYGVAKAGVVQLTRETCFAWARHKIRVNAILPCQFTNAWWAEMQADPANRALVARVLNGIPLGRLGDAQEIVGPVLFLASDAASMVTGAILPVDGGNLAMNAGGSIEW
jgi:NAD(P)-dependent dehydrogenase (short-subunit alcohol dehydrogenase family)